MAGQRLRYRTADDSRTPADHATARAARAICHDVRKGFFNAEVGRTDGSAEGLLAVSVRGDMLDAQWMFSHTYVVSASLDEAVPELSVERQFDRAFLNGTWPSDYIDMKTNGSLEANWEQNKNGYLLDNNNLDRLSMCHAPRIGVIISMLSALWIPIASVEFSVVSTTTMATNERGIRGRYHPFGTDRPQHMWYYLDDFQRTQDSHGSLQREGQDLDIKFSERQSHI